MTVTVPNCWTMNTLLSATRFVLRITIWLLPVWMLNPKLHLRQRHADIKSPLGGSTLRSITMCGTNPKSHWSLTPGSTNAPVPPHNRTGTVPDSVEGSLANIVVEDTSSLQPLVSWWSIGGDVGSNGKGKKAKWERQSRSIDNPPVSKNCFGAHR